MSDNSTSPAPPLAEQAKEQAHQAVEQGKQAVQQGKEMAGGLLDRAREQVKSQLGTQKDNAAAGLSDVAQALLLSSNHLQGQGQGAVAQLGDKAAEQITRLSGYLRERDVDDVVDEVQNFARQQPALFLGSAVLLGLVAARFLKSTGVGGASATTSSSDALLPVPVGKPYDAGGVQPESRDPDVALRTSDAI
ncbi:MAG: hypothetical protein JO250_16740 [Armatimonadetes bacterium]|nr:hypothetical protein [Armatimonadota bacterium]